MALPFQIVDIPLGTKGADENTDPKLMAPGGTTEVLNGIFDKDGSIAKRAGFVAGGTFGSLSSMVRLVSCNDTPYVAAESTLSAGYTRIWGIDNALSGLGIDDFLIFGLPRATVRRDPILRAGSEGTQSADHGYANGFHVGAWYEENGLGVDASGTKGARVMVRITQESDGHTVYLGSIATRLTTTEGNVRCASNPDGYVLITFTNGELSIYGSLVDCTYPVAGTYPSPAAAVQMITNQNSSDRGNYDVCSLSITPTGGAGGGWCIGYHDNSDNVRATTFDLLTLASSHSNNFNDSTPTLITAPTWIAVCERQIDAGGNHGIYVGSSGTGGVDSFYSIWNVDGTTTKTVDGAHIGQTFNYLNTGCVSIGPSKDLYRCWLVAGVPSSLDDGSGGYYKIAQMRLLQLDTSGTTPTPYPYSRVLPLSKPFTYGGMDYVWLADYYDQVLVLLSITTSQPITTAAFGQSTIGFVADPRSTVVYDGYNTYHMAVADMGSGKFASGAMVYTLPGDPTGLYPNFDRLVIDFNDKRRYANLELAGVSYFGGGILSELDGTSWREVGFIQSPPILHLHESVSLGGLQPGDYSYVAVYEVMDNAGNLIRSQVGAPKTITVIGSNVSVDVWIPYASLTYHQDDWGGAISTLERMHRPQIAIYRTAVNGSVYQRLQVRNDTSTDLSNLVGGTSSLVDDHIKYSDTKSDSDIAANEILYTSSDPSSGVAGELASEPLWGGAIALASHKQRLWGVPAEDQTILCYSKEVVAQRTAEFSSNQIIRVGEKIIAIASLDDALIVFCRKRIWAVFGNGPDATGGNNDYGNPILIASDSGAIDPHVAVYPDGVMYLSDKGLATLTRGRQVVYHQEMQDTVSTIDYIRATTINPLDGLVLILIGGGTIIVYDYVHKRFATWKVALDDTHTLIDLAWIDSKLYALGSDNYIYVQTPGTYTDNGNWYGMEVITGWLNFGSIESYKRLRRWYVLGDRIGFHGLNVYVARDYDSNWGNAELYSYADDVLSIQGDERIRIHNVHQKSDAFRLKFKETQATHVVAPNTAGFRLTSVSAEVASKGTLEKTAYTSKS